MATIYRLKPFPGHEPTKEEMDTYLARLAALGQIDYYQFSGYGRIGILIAGIFFVIAAIGIAYAVVISL